MSDTANIARLHIALTGTEPLIWRRIEVALAITLEELHEIIQAALPWDDSHLYEFTIGGRRFGVPDPDASSEAEDVGEVTLDEALKGGLVGFAYVYDMGDYWEHVITVEALELAPAGTKYPRYLDGERRAPPDDCGGIPGFAEFLADVANPRSAAGKAALEWVGGAYDPAAADIAEIKAGFAALARPAGKARKP